MQVRGGYGEQRENLDNKTWTVVSKERNVLVDILNADPEIITDVDTSIVLLHYCRSDLQTSQVTMKAGSGCNARSSVMVQMRSYKNLAVIASYVLAQIKLHSYIIL